jgi:anti-sigma-K factor RskA
MERPMKHAELQELLGLYALRALEPPDVAALEAHLEACRSCRAELAGLEDAAAELAWAAGPVEPSAAATRRILDVPRFEPVPAPRAARRPAPAPRPRRWRLVSWAASVAVAVVVGILVVSQIKLLDRLDRALYMLSRGRDLLEFIASPEVTTVALTAGESVPRARAFASYHRRSGRVILFAFNLPPPPEGQLYQLWLISDGFRPAAAFAPDALGGTVLQAEWPPERRELPLLFAITLEPSAGAGEPTGDILLLGGTPAARFEFGR